MSRSNKKGPYIDQKLMKKVMGQKKANKKEPIKTWARSCQIPPEFVGHSFQVHSGRHFIDVFVTEAMVGHRLGEFAPTRTFRGHGRVVKRLISKT
jgi:small subunit ribosomal protein S19